MVRAVDVPAGRGTRPGRVPSARHSGWGLPTSILPAASIRRKWPPRACGKSWCGDCPRRWRQSRSVSRIGVQPPRISRTSSTASSPGRVTTPAGRSRSASEDLPGHWSSGRQSSSSCLRTRRHRRAVHHSRVGGMTHASTGSERWRFRSSRRRPPWLMSNSSYKFNVTCRVFIQLKQVIDLSPSGFCSKCFRPKQSRSTTASRLGKTWLPK